MKITEKLAKAEREGRTFWSFEFFPPRTAQVSLPTDPNRAELRIPIPQRSFGRLALIYQGSAKSL